MRVETYDSGPCERSIVTAMIADREVLARLAGRWDRDLMESPQLARVAGWCVDHWRKYADAPRGGIAGYHAAWVERSGGRDEDGIEDLLASMSGEFERNGDAPNPARTVDVAGEHFRKVALKKLAAAVEADVGAGRIDEAEARVARHTKVDVTLASGVNLLTDEDAIRAAFEREDQRALFAYPGDLGRFFANSLERDALLAFCGPQKSGKTFWLIDLAWRAMCQRRRVAFFEVGDLADWELHELFLTRAAKHPSRSDDGWPCEVRWPDSCRKGRDEKTEVGHELLRFDGPLDGKRALAAARKVTTKTLKSAKPFLQLQSFPNLSISALGLRDVLDGWSTAGFVPDVIVIDYADNLAPSDKREEGRDRINTTWKLLKALAQERRCLVVTATQVNAAGFTKKVLDRTNFSEDNRKLSHVNGMVGINVSAEDKEADVSRLNWIVKRKGRYSVYHTISVAGCRALANVAALSCWGRKSG